MSPDDSARPEWQEPGLDPLTDPDATADRTAAMRNLVSGGPTT